MRVEVKIRADNILGEIDPMIYGQYLEHVEDCIYPALMGEDGLREDVIAVAKDLQVPLVRWPGGCFADIYNWEDGIGEPKSRPGRLNWYWGGFESNQFGTDEFLKWCEQTGAKPYINVNMGTGTLEQAIAWLDYCNGQMPTADVKRRQANGRQEPYKVKYWGLGNETWGHWEPGHSDAKTYAWKLREWAQFFKKVDPSVKLLAVGSEGGNDPDWDRTVLEIAGHHLDYLTIHMYGHTTHLYDPDDYYDTVANVVSFETRLQSFCTLIEEARENYKIQQPIKVAIDEWNIRHLDLEPGANVPHLRRASFRTLKDALFVAGVFHTMHRFSDLVKMGCHVFFANGNAVLNVHSGGVIESTLADVFRVYRKLFVGEVLAIEKLKNPTVNIPVRQSYLETKVQPFEFVDISAVRGERGQINIALINRHREERAEVSLDLGFAYRVLNTQVLHSEDVLAVNDLENPTRVRFKEIESPGIGEPISCLPHSITILECAKL